MKYVAAFTSSASLTEFRLPEFVSVAKTLRIPITVLDASIPWISSGGDPHWFSVFESNADADALLRLAERCILLRGIYVLLSSALTVESLYRSLDSSMSAEPGPLIDAVIGEGVADEEGSTTGVGCSYCYQVETVGKKYSGEMKRCIIEEILQRRPQRGSVEYKEPQRRYVVFFQHAVEAAPSGAKDWVPNGPLLRIFYGRLLVESRRCALLSKYDLRRRPYIGTTSMPPEESIVMSNFSGVIPGHYVFDPFCGTGSLLIAAAHCGAQTIGSDADGRAMRSGTEKGKISPQMQQQRSLALSTYTEEQLSCLTADERACPSMISNFKVYGLPLPDRARMNFSAWQRAWRCVYSTHCFFDAIITDPPYGLREPRRKVQSSTGGNGCSSSVVLSAYPTNEVILDLVLFAAQYLELGGRLTFWHPTTDHYTDDELPSHPSLRTIYNIPQRMSLKVVRRLIVMEKIIDVPNPPPSRESCAAKQSTDDLRLMMDATVLPDNKEYMQYRARRERRREAAKLHMSTHPGEQDDTHYSFQQRKANRIDGQVEIVANRQRNIEIRLAKQLASHIANASHHSRVQKEEGKSKEKEEV